jgi:hypothetical protein
MGGQEGAPFGVFSPAKCVHEGVSKVQNGVFSCHLAYRGVLEGGGLGRRWGLRGGVRGSGSVRILIPGDGPSVCHAPAQAVRNSPQPFLMVFRPDGKLACPGPLDIEGLIVTGSTQQCVPRWRTLTESALALS